MEKEFGVKFGQMITLVMLLLKCAAQNCAKETKSAAINKKLAAKYAQFKVEENKAKKLKLLGEINKTKIMYELNTCVIKNCKTLVNDLLSKLKEISNIVPKNSPKYERMIFVINEIETVINTPELTEKQYNKHIKNINDILATLD